MRLKEFIRTTFNNDGVLDVYEHGRHEVNQPFNSETGERFKDQDEALSWLLKYYPNYFTP